MDIKVMMNMLTLLYFISVALWGCKVYEIFHTLFVGDWSRTRKTISAVIIAVWGLVLLAVLLTRYFYWS